jgi:hypothetical protein
MKRLLTLALVLGTLASAFATSARRGTGMPAPPPPQTQTIILNTGYDQWLASPTLIAVGQKDNEWRVITDTVNGVPDPSIATGRPADVVSNNIWGVFQDANFPNSRWISIGPNQGAPLPTPPNQFQYAYYFTLPVGFSNPLLTMKLSSDDHITKVTLNSHTLFQGSGGIFINPPLMIPTLANPTTLADFMSGSDVNVLTVDVEDTAGGITGLIVDGTVTYQDCDRLPVKDIPGLNSITFWESTFAAPTQHTFAKLGSELTTKRSGALSSTNMDFEGVPGAEFYDVFYSGWDGTFAPDGQFITIEAEWPVGAPSGGGLNIARVDFNGTGQFANSVSSFVCLGNNALPSDVGKAVDGSVGTDTTMGNTLGQTQRLRLTVGFPCCASPPPGMVAWWPLDELDPTTGEYVDLVGGDNNGTPIGNPSQVPGQYVGNSLQAGIGKYVEVPDAMNLNFGLGSFTIDAWVRFTSAGTQQEPIVYKLASSSGTKGGYFLFLVSQGAQWQLQLQVATKVYAGPIITPMQGEWIFVAATVDKTTFNTGTVSLYAGTPGSPLAIAPSAAGAFSASSPGASLLIGQKIPDPHASLGIDEVEIFNRALTQQPELQSIFNAGSAGKCKCAITCPSNITKSSDLNQCGAVVTYTAPTPAQSCGSVVCSPASGSFFPKGTTTVTCSTTAGQSCTFTVTVNDTQPPTISASAVVVLIGAGSQCSRAYFGVTASDNCAAVTKTCTPPSGTCFPVGTTTVTCTATDSSGNTATTSFIVTIPNPFDIHRRVGQ